MSSSVEEKTAVETKEENEGKSGGGDAMNLVPPTKWKMNEPMHREDFSRKKKNKKGKNQGQSGPKPEVNLVSPWVEESDQKNEVVDGGVAIWSAHGGKKKVKGKTPSIDAPENSGTKKPAMTL